ncbi:hypothetical protein, partial [Vibrio mediterranei]|uniref:hypothetical protein n=1 Tax=Vibrio mediterranei TaxID=689 RepID=UPI00148CD5B4
DGDNVYDATLTATDADGNTADTALKVTVTNVVERNKQFYTVSTYSSVGSLSSYPPVESSGWTSSGTVKFVELLNLGQYVEYEVNVQYEADFTLEIYYGNQFDFRKLQLGLDTNGIRTSDNIGQVAHDSAATYVNGNVMRYRSVHLNKGRNVLRIYVSSEISGWGAPANITHITLEED